jgi:hypothetical protein
MGEGRKPVMRYSENLRRGAEVLNRHFGGDWSRMLASSTYEDGVVRVQVGPSKPAGRAPSAASRKVSATR